MPAKVKSAKVRHRDHYHHGDLRSTLIAAGRQVLAEEGLHGFTLRACARRAGVSHAAPAHHFACVADLLAEIAAAGFDELTASMKHFAEQGDSGDAAAYLHGLGRGYVAFAVANRAVFQLMFRREAFSFQSERFATAAGSAFACLVEAVAALLPDAPSDEHELAVDLAWSTVHGFATLVIEGQICQGQSDPAAIDRRLANILSLSVGSVARPAAPRSRGTKDRKRDASLSCPR
jgi:AcrR family transcriptional regulator